MTTPGFELPPALVSQDYALRPETDADTPFLLALYASTRERDLALLPWSAQQKQAFLAGQFQAQRYHYRTYFAACAFDILEWRSEAFGRLYLDARPSHLHIVDIALMPEWRSKGVGTAVLTALQDAGRASGKTVDIFVEKFNPALRLYRRLGFTDVADHDVYLEMTWQPPRDQLKTA